MRGIYAHVNKIDGRVFYVGQQRVNNNRAYDFKTQRNDRYKKYIKEIGIKNVEVVWLYESGNNSESLFTAEWIYQNKYYQNGFLKTNELIFNGENNPNYNNRWNKKQRKAMSDRMRNRYVGKDNPNYGHKWNDEKKEEARKRAEKQGGFSGTNNPKASSCILYGPHGFKKKFELLKDMSEWVAKNIIHGELKYTESINLNHHIKKEYKVLDDWRYEAHTRH